jgi:hypothetical protein
MSATEEILNDAHGNVLSYRLTRVEQELIKIDGKLDIFSQNYPNSQTLALMLDPLISRVRELEDKEKDEEKRKNDLVAQLKLAVVVAALSPLISVGLTILLGSQ